MSWSTKETEAASALRGDVLQPLSVDADDALPGAYRPEISRDTVDLPLPDPPTSATCCPGPTDSENPVSSGLSSGL